MSSFFYKFYYFHKISFQVNDGSMEIRVTDYFDDDESLLFSSSDAGTDSDESSGKEATEDEASKDVTEGKTVEKSKIASDKGLNSTAPNGRSRRRRRRRRRGESKRRERRPRDRRRGGSAFRRGQLMLIERLIRALKHRKQKLLGGGDSIDESKRSTLQEENPVAVATESMVGRS